MKKEGLTAKQVQHMKPGEKRFEVPAGQPAGLYLVVHPTGRKTWMYRYRYRGRTRGLTFKDPYPDLSLAGARAEAEAALADLRQDIDPARTQEPVEARQADVFKAVVDEFIERYAKRNKSWKETARILKKEAVSKWKSRAIEDITRADVLRLLDAIIDRGAETMANRTHSALGKLFKWSEDRGIIEVSPMAGVKAPAREQSRERTLAEAELVEVWNAAGTLDYPFGPFFRLLILTAQRRGEVAAMRWRDADLDAALWTLPAEATKAGRIHDVPLSSAALELLDSLPRFKGAYVFTTTSGRRPISGFSKAKARLDAAILEARKRAAGTEQVDGLADWTVHDLRRTAATLMAKNNVAPHVLGAILNHTPGRTQGITAIYNRHRYAQERRQALEEWANYLNVLTEAKEKSATA